jgi:hypothetical protein
MLNANPEFYASLCTNKPFWIIIYLGEAVQTKLELCGAEATIAICQEIS